MLKIKCSQDFWAGVLLLTFGTTMFIGAAHLAQGTAVRMGPGYTPRLLCGLLMMTGVALVLQSMNNPGPSTGAWNIRPLIFVLGSIVFFGFALEKLGLVITTLITVAISGYATKDARPLELAIVALAMAGGCTLLFIYGLKLVIPVWPQFG